MVNSVANGSGLNLWNLYFKDLEKFQTPIQPGQLAPGAPAALDGMGFASQLLDGMGALGLDGMSLQGFGAGPATGITAASLLQSQGVPSMEARATHGRFIEQLDDMSAREIHQALQNDPQFAQQLNQALRDPRAGSQILGDSSLLEKLAQALMMDAGLDASGVDSSIMTDPTMAELIAQLLSNRERRQSGSSPQVGSQGFNPVFNGRPAAPPVHNQGIGPLGTDNRGGAIPRSAATGSGGANQIQLDVPAISQFDSSRVQGAGSDACYRACRAIAAAMGVNIPAGTAGNKIQVARSENSVGQVTVDPQGLAEARSYIDQQLEAGRPVVVGVSHKDASYNSDGMTDHFVVVTGRGVDENGNTYYTYNDPAAGVGNEAAGMNQRFYVDPENGNLVHQGNVANGLVRDRHTEMSMVIRSS